MVRKKYEPNKGNYTAAANGQENDSLVSSKGSPLSKTVTVVRDADDAHELSPLRPIDDVKEEEAVKVVAQAPDGGYGWVIVLASFFCNFIVDGVAYSFAIYLIEWSDYFPFDGKDKISWVGSLLNGVYLCMGPISTALTNAFGFRIVIFSGAIITAIAFILSAFATSVNMLIGTFGILGGIGFGLIYSPAILCVCYYFDKKRALAVGICVCGSGVGAFVFPPLIQMTVDHFGWAASMLILAGLVLQVCIAGALMRTLEVEVVEVIEVRPLGGEEKLLIEGNTTQTFVRDEPLNRAASVGQKPAGNFRDLKHVVLPRTRNRSDSEPATDVEVVKSRKYFSTHGIDVQTIEKGRVQHKLVSGSHRHYFSTPDIFQGVRKVRHVETAHPFDRKDVHLQGSLKHLDRASKEQADVVAFNRGSQSSVSRRQKQIETVDSLAPVLPVATKKSWMPPQLRQALVELSDLRIYTDTVFIIFSISSFLGMIAFYIPFMFISDYAVRNFETERDMASFLISGIGLTNIFGRLFWGWLADRPNMDPLIIYNACILLVGVVLGFVPLCTDYTGLMAVCVVFGFFVSPFISLLSIILTSRIGLELLPSAFGQSQFVRGIASMIGSPIGGALYEQTKSYTSTFLASGAEFIVASLIASLILVMELVRRKRKPVGKAEILA